MDVTLPRIIGAVVALRIVLSVVGLIALQDGHREPIRGEWEELIFPGNDPATRLLSMWQRWDALWYQHIAQQGYNAGDGTTAFFPLYPLLARIVSAALGGNVVVAELLISTVALIAAVWWLHRLTALEFATMARPGVTTWLTPSAATVLLVILFPVAFFLFAPYTEGLFLALSVASFLFARQGRPWMAGLAGFFAGLTRTQGGFLALPLAYERLRTWWPRRRHQPFPFSVVASMLPGLGVLVTWGAQAAITGQGQSGLGVLAHWGYRVVLPWEAVAASWRAISGLAPMIGGSSVEVEALNLVVLVGALGLAVAALRVLPLSHALYAFPSIVLLLTRDMAFSPLMSVARYVMVVFPCFLVLTMALIERPRLLAAWLAVSGALMLYLFGFWVRWGFVG